jgi:hypothetical protein
MKQSYCIEGGLAATGVPEANTIVSKGLKWCFFMKRGKQKAQRHTVL